MEIVLLIVLLVTGFPFALGMFIGYTLGKRRKKSAAPDPGKVHPYSQVRRTSQAPDSEQHRQRPGWTYPAHTDTAASSDPVPGRDTPGRSPAAGSPSPPETFHTAEPTAQPASEASAAADRPVGQRRSTTSPTATAGQHSRPQRTAPQSPKPPSTRQRPPAPPKKPRKPRDEAQLINIALYIGGLVLTAAALAFTAVMQSPEVTAASLIGAYLVFAVVGLWLATRVKVLRPAGLALFGTSLALLAVLAVPVNEAFIDNGILTWLLVSLTGLVIYGIASVHLDSRVLGYLVIPFLYSTVLSSTAVLQQPLVWTLVGIIVISTAVQLAVFVLGSRVPAVLTRPFGQLHWIVVPAVLLAAIMLAADLASGDYVILFGAGTAHYAVLAVRPQQSQLRVVYVLAARILATATVISLLVVSSLSREPFLGILAIWFLIHFTAVTLVPALSGRTSTTTAETLPWASLSITEFRRIDLNVAMVLGLVASLMAQYALVLNPNLSTSGHLWVSAAAAVMIGVAAVSLLRLNTETLPARAWVLRFFLTVALVFGLIFHYWYAVLWAAVWLLAESRMSAPGMRGRWQRGLSVGLLAALGWAAGRSLDDVLLGSRLVLVAVLAGAVLWVVQLRLRVRRTHRYEARIYWGIAVAAGICGVAVFGFSGWAQLLYAAGMILLSYALLALLSGAGTADLVKAGRFGGFLVAVSIAALSTEWSHLRLQLLWDTGPVAEVEPAVRTALLLLTVLVAEVGAGAWWRRRRGGGLLRHWVPVHLGAHLVWLTVLYLMSVITGVAGLWWTTPALLGLVAMSLLRSAHRSADSGLSADRITAGIYSAVVGVSAAAALIGAGLWWWADTVAGGAALGVAAAAVLWAPRGVLTSAAAPLLAAAGAYLVVGSLWAEIFSGMWGAPAVTVHVAASAVVFAVLAVFRAALPRIGAESGPGLLTGVSGLVLSFTGVVTLFPAPWPRRELAAGPATSPALELGLAGGLALLVIAGLYLLLGMGMRGRRDQAGTLTVERAAVFSAAALIAIGAVHWGRLRPELLWADIQSGWWLAAVWALVVAFWLLSAELILGRRLSQGARGSGVTSRGGTRLRHWIPLHVAGHGAWFAGLHLMATVWEIGHLGWITAAGGAAAAVWFFALAGRSRVEADRDVLTGRIYAVGVVAMLILIYFGYASAWWAVVIVTAAAAGLAAAAVQLVPRVGETPVAAPLLLMAGGHGLAGALLNQTLSAELTSGVIAHGAAAVTVVSLVVLVLTGLRRYRGLAAGQVLAGVSALSVLLVSLGNLMLSAVQRSLSDLMLSSVQRSLSDTAETLMIQGSAALLGILALGALYILCLRGLQHRRLAEHVIMWSRLAVFAAAGVLVLLAVDWSSVDLGAYGQAGAALRIGASAWLLALAAALAAAEVGAAARISRTVLDGRQPPHRWIPAHLSLNAMWVGITHLVLVLTGAPGGLWWFTALAWAISCAVYLRAAARSAAAKDLLPARLYGAGTAVLALLALPLVDHWWAMLAAAAAAALVAAAGLQWGPDLPEVPIAAPIYAGAGAALAAAAVLAGLAQSGTWQAHSAVTGYISASAAFLAVGGAATWGRGRITLHTGRRALTTTSASAALLASVAPLLSAVPGVTPALAWTVPAMHAALVGVGLSRVRLRRWAGLIGAALIPVSGLFAWGMWTEVTSSSIAVTLLLVTAAALGAEAALFPTVHTGTETQAQTRFSRTFYVLAGAVTVASALLGLTSAGAIVQAAPLAGGSMLLVAGLLRSRRIGVLWGAAVIVVAVLWALRETMFLFLVALGALIIGAAVWRLLALQKKAQSQPQHSRSGADSTPKTNNLP